MHQTSVDGVDDMANLGDLHDAAILHNLHLRYKSDKIYVSDWLLLALKWLISHGQDIDCCHETVNLNCIVLQVKSASGPGGPAHQAGV